MFKSIRAGSPRSPFRLIAVLAGGDGEDHALPTGLDLDAAERKAIKAAAAAPGFKAEPGEIRVVDDRTALLGLGTKGDLDEKGIRTVGARVARALERIAPKQAAFHLGKAIDARKVPAFEVGRLLGEGLGIADWRVDEFDGTATKRSERLPALVVGADDGDLKSGLEEGLGSAASVNASRRISATPPNVCRPSWIASETKKLARAAGLKCRVITRDEAAKKGMGGIEAVGRGSSDPPCMVVLEHKPPRPRGGVRLALVGKTMTYDTGGYSLKIQGSMRGMKNDGNGGAAVVGAMLEIARRNLPVHVYGLLPCAENMISGDAYRPDDIITMYNGVTCEVTNTDAEGRLILADALAYACKDLKATAIVDTATLTGGVVVALGSACAGLWCEDDDLRDRIGRASDRSGERTWRLPLFEDYRDMMRAKHADVWNSAPKRDAHPIQGAAFLSYFVDEDVPWAHVDIAGTSVSDADTPMHVSGPTGFGVRLLAETAASFV